MSVMEGLSVIEVNSDLLNLLFKLADRYITESELEIFLKGGVEMQPLGKCEYLAKFKGCRIKSFRVITEMDIHQMKALAERVEELKQSYKKGVAGFSEVIQAHNELIKFRGEIF